MNSTLTLVSLSPYYLPLSPKCPVHTQTLNSMKNLKFYLLILVNTTHFFLNQFAISYKSINSIPYRIIGFNL